MSGRGGAKRKTVDAKQPLITQFCIADYPHVRSAKMRCWKQTAPISGYTRWRGMQQTLNRKMHAILSLTEVAELSLLRTTEMAALRKRLRPYAAIPRESSKSGGTKKKASKSKAKKRELNIGEISNLDTNPDADVKFFLNGTFRVSRSSLLRQFTGSDLRARETPPNSVLQGYLGGGLDDDDDDLGDLEAEAEAKDVGDDAAAPYPFHACSGPIAEHPLMHGAPKVVLVGTDLHIAIAILWPPGTFDGPGADAASDKHLTVEFFDSRGADECLMIPNIASFFFSVMGEHHPDPSKLIASDHVVVEEGESSDATSSDNDGSSRAARGKMKMSAKMKIAVASKYCGSGTEDEASREIMSMMALHKTKKTSKKRGGGEASSSDGGRPVVDPAVPSDVSAMSSSSSSLPVDIWSTEGNVRFVSCNNDDWQADEPRKIDQHHHLSASSKHQINRTLKARASGGWSDQRLRAELDQCSTAPQLEELDVFCQTWIYFYVYMRLRAAGVSYGMERCGGALTSEASAKAADGSEASKVSEIMAHIRSLTPTQRLDQIKRFQTWVYDWHPSTSDHFVMTDTSKPRKVWSRKKKSTAKALIADGAAAGATPVKKEAAILRQTEAALKSAKRKLPLKKKNRGSGLGFRVRKKARTGI